MEEKYYIAKFNLKNLNFTKQQTLFMNDGRATLVIKSPFENRACARQISKIQVLCQNHQPRLRLQLVYISFKDFLCSWDQKRKIRRNRAVLQTKCLSKMVKSFNACKSPIKIFPSSRKLIKRLLTTSSNSKVIRKKKSEVIMAIGPTIDPADVGTTGLIWLFFSYGYALFYSANLIGEGSELLLLVPSMAGLVGGVVLPLLGAVPDGAIILFSGLGSIEVAQDSLSVGIGALAGSTIMLLTIPWALSVFAGRVDIINGNPNYRGKIKLFPGKSTSETLRTTGVAVSDEIRHGGIVMALTTIPYFLIQIPAMFMHGPTEEVAEGEHWWALGSLLMCLIGLVAYMVLQLKFNDAGQSKDKRIAIAKKTLQEGKMSLKGVVKSTIKTMESKRSLGSVSDGTGYDAIPSDSEPSPEILSELKELLHDAFRAYDSDGNGTLEKHEIRVFLKDFHENIDEDTVNEICARVDKDNDNLISLDEFVILCYYLIMSDDDHSTKNAPVVDNGFRASIQAHVFKDDDGEGDDDEVEDIPEDFTDLSPEDQQAAIKLRAFKMLFVGTLMVVYFSDPMVDVMQEIAVKCSIPPFYVSFVLAPLASNSSEVIASMFYAAKKTRKTMTVSLSALEGAACMNNTFCLCIFMGLIYARGLAWQYTAETASIVVVQFIMALLVQKDVMTCGTALGVLAIFPLSLVFVFTMENYLGFD